MLADGASSATCTPCLTATRAAYSSISPVPWSVTVGPSAAIWAFATSPCGVPIVAKRNVTDSAAAERMRTFTTTPS